MCFVLCSLLELVWALFSLRFIQNIGNYSYFLSSLHHFVIYQVRADRILIATFGHDWLKKVACKEYKRHGIQHSDVYKRYVNVEEVVEKAVGAEKALQMAPLSGLFHYFSV